MRALAILLAILFVGATPSALAQLIPAPMSAPGAMRVGCPSDWEHRDAAVGSFSCRDTETSAYCGMPAPSPADALSAARSIDDASDWARTWFAAQGAVLLGERREGRAHLFWMELRGQHLAVIVIPDRMGYAQVNCGAGTGDLDALLPTFAAIAASARR